jgi:hypothetical protein
MNKLQSFIASKFLGITEEKLMRLTEQYPAGIDQDEYQYRRLSDMNVKGLNPITRDRQLEIVFTLFLKNGLAKRILEIRNDFIFGDGFTYTIAGRSKGKKQLLPKFKIQQATAVLDEFWKVNNMDLRFEKKGYDLSLNGMLILPVFINKINGQVRLGFIDPKNVDRVNTNPLNVEEINSIKLKGIGNISDSKRELLAIKINEDPKSELFGMLDGECFYFSINNVSNQPEGVSDLLASADWLDMLDQMLFDVVQYMGKMHKYFQDVELLGADDKKIEEWKKTNPISENLARFVHNEKVKYNLITPDIKKADPSDVVRLYKNIVLGSQGYPEHWFADGGNTNLATATAQEGPTLRALKKRQQYVIFILQTIFKFVLHKAIAMKREGFSLTKDDVENIIINVKVPDFERKDYNKISDGLEKVGNYLTTCVKNKWVSNDTAGDIARTIIDMIGVEIDDETERAAIEQEKNNPDKQPAAADPVPDPNNPIPDPNKTEPIPAE